MEPRTLEFKGRRFKDSEINLLGIPYGGPDYLEGNDLQKEKFTEKTDTGPLPYVLTYFDHAKSLSKGKQLVGMSEFVEKTNYGEVYRLWVEETEEYDEMISLLKQLHSEKRLK